jgi:formylglycine-generating enzyme required for sulfatase activity
MADIFISYAREDRSRIEPLAKALEELGWSVFWDRTIPTGKTWHRFIGDALKSACAVIVAWSQESIDSDWVREEAESGRRRGILIPILIDAVDPPLGFGAIQAADLVNWDPAKSSPEFVKLIADISIILGPSPKHVREEEKAAEEARIRKQQEESKQRKDEERRKAEEESQRLELEERRIEEEKQERAKAERKAQDELKRKEAKERAEPSKKEEGEIKIESTRAELKEKNLAEVSEEQPEKTEAEQSEPETDRREPQGINPATKIGTLIALAVAISAGVIWLFLQEVTRLPETSPPKGFMNSIGMEFVLIPAGSFTMGSQLRPTELASRFGGTEKDYEDEQPRHDVRISQSFYLQTNEVSQDQWKKLMGDNPSRFDQCGGDCPVEQVSWYDARRFIEKLNQLEKTTAYRLPSEAEWEYACRAGTTTEYSFGDDDSKLGEYAWYSGNSESRTHRAATRKPNSSGLYDMHGNVWEWVEDDAHSNYEGAPSDGRAWVSYPRTVGRVVRGSGWKNVTRDCRSAVRSILFSDQHYEFVGFRLAKSISR